jgi:hypothetical protein
MEYSATEGREGDVLVIVGDRGYVSMVRSLGEAVEWLAGQPRFCGLAGLRAAYEETNELLSRMIDKVDTYLHECQAGTQTTTSTVGTTTRR